MSHKRDRLMYSQFLEGAMTFTHAASVIVFGGLILFSHGCAAPNGDVIATDHGNSIGHMATVAVSPTLAVSVPVNVALGDKVAEAAANAAVGYLKGLPGAITSLSRAEAVQQGVDAGVRKAAETGQQVDRKVLETFVQGEVAKTGL